MADEEKLSEDPTLPPQARRSTDLPSDAPWWAHWLVANATEGWRWLSVQWPVLCAVLIEMYTQYQDQISALLPPEWMPRLAQAAFVITALLRFINQPPKAKEEKP